MKTFKKLSFTFMLCFMFIAGGSSIVKGQQISKLFSDLTGEVKKTDLEEVSKKETKKTCSGCTTFILINPLGCDITLTLLTDCGDVTVTIPAGQHLCMNGYVTADCGQTCVLGIKNSGGAGSDISLCTGCAPSSHDFGLMLAGCGGCATGAHLFVDYAPGATYLPCPGYSGTLTFRCQ